MLWKAKKTVISLYDYLHIKGLYLYAKIKPEDDTLVKEENINFIVDFLDKTNLRLFPFWSKLERWVVCCSGNTSTVRSMSPRSLLIVFTMSIYECSGTIDRVLFDI